ncbi:MAG: M14 family metallopeptidase, partial [Gammaproteobacteria bacterium]|nr:M14 family metallopeptidase [Gammaproteobacteria bacterium]
MTEHHFSKTFAESRRRFKDSAESTGADISSYSIDADCEEELAIDVATVGADDLPTVVTTSGVHGVEGFFGSAVQHALLERLIERATEQHIRHVLIHAVNPFGFSQLRRVNEDNVDLNRNFRENTGSYNGAPDGYANLNKFLNPESPPSRIEPFKLKAMWNIWRQGLQALKQSVAGGQYEYPRGLFFGGHSPCQSTQIICENCDAWIGSAEKVIHIDFHTGLGSFGTYKLLVAEREGSGNIAWYTDIFGADSVEPLDESASTAYKISGLFGNWMQKHFASRDYRFVGAEFGTYDAIRVLGALRAENRAHHYGDENSEIYKSAKAELLECFYPSDASWRKQTIES